MSVRSLAGRLLTSLPTKYKRALNHLSPIIQERREKIQAAANGEEYLEKPNDMLMWQLESQKGKVAPPEEISIRMLTLNFAAIHSTSSVRRWMRAFFRHRD